MLPQPYAFGWGTSIATIVVGIAAVLGLLVQLGRRSNAPAPAPTGVWESRASTSDGTVETRRIVFAGAQAGQWLRVGTRDGHVVWADSARFSLEGPRGNRFCIQRDAGASDDCRIVLVAQDSLVMMFGVPTVELPAGAIRWVFHPRR